MSMGNGREDFQAWIDVIGDDLPDIATLCHLLEQQDKRKKGKRGRY